MCIKGVSYVRDLDSKLLSVGQFLREGYTIVLEDSFCSVFLSNTKKQFLFKVPMAKDN